jgi:hypothetical protein
MYERTVYMNVLIAVLEGFHGSVGRVADQAAGTLTRLQLAHFAYELVDAAVEGVNGRLEVVAALMDSNAAARAGQNGAALVDFLGNGPVEGDEAHQAVLFENVLGGQLLFLHASSVGDIYYGEGNIISNL